MVKKMAIIDAGLYLLYRPYFLKSASLVKNKRIGITKLITAQSPYHANFYLEQPQRTIVHLRQLVFMDRLGGYVDKTNAQRNSFVGNRCRVVGIIVDMFFDIFTQ